VVVIGAMKCATTAVHCYLDAHPDVAMSDLKELNFFNGPERTPPGDVSTWWRCGQWHRGLGWYARHFDADARVRGESSPAYTSPSFPEVAARMAEVVPDARLVYLVRDPVDRAVSQYAHHRRDGDERRPLAEALLDPHSQYVARSRYAERLRPHLEHRPADQVLVVVQEHLRDRPQEQLARLYDFVGVDPQWWGPELEVPIHEGAGRPDCPADLRDPFLELVADDLVELADLLGDEAPAWTTAA
jgi:uncharacterized protein YndB with AHSA1/START domain